MEIPFERYLETLGISGVAEWDVLVFVRRHGTIIASVANMVRLIGYSESVVESALDKLTRAGLIQGSRGSDGTVGLYKFTPLDTVARQSSFEALMKTANQPNGRLQLIRSVRR